MNSAEVEENWAALMECHFNFKLDMSMQAVWFSQLRRMVGGWGYDAETEDPTKDGKAKIINRHLCKVIPYIAGMESVPRKRAGRKDPGSRFNVGDLALWVWIYNRHHQSADAGIVSFVYLECVKRTIQDLLAQGRDEHAAIVATGNTTAYCDVGELGSNRGPTPAEARAIHEFCREIDFDAHGVLMAPLDEAQQSVVGDMTEELAEQCL